MTLSVAVYAQGGISQHFGVAIVHVAQSDRAQIVAHRFDLLHRDNMGVKSGQSFPRIGTIRIHHAAEPL
jgi:hypothetical protein